MGRIIVQVKITNLFNEDKSIKCGMFVDTGAGALILPEAWKEKLGEFKRSEPVELLLANKEVIKGEDRSCFQRCRESGTRSGRCRLVPPRDKR